MPVLDPRDVVVVPRARARIVRAVAVTVGVVTIAALLFRSGVLDQVSDQEQLRSTVEDAGVLGPLLYLSLMVLLVPLNVPGLLFVIPATTLFGTVGGVALALVGGFLASSVGIVAARRLGRAAFDARVSPRVRRIEEQISRRGFWAVVVVRCFTFLLQPVDWLCGLSSMRMRTVLSATFVGLVPPTLLVAVTGGSVLDLVL